MMGKFDSTFLLIFAIASAFAILLLIIMGIYQIITGECLFGVK